MKDRVWKWLAKPVFYPVCALLFSSACYGAQDEMPKYLSKTGIYIFKSNQLSLADDLVPYEVRQKLFADYALKWRAVKLGGGNKVMIDANGLFHFPNGTVFVKSFYYIRVNGSQKTLLKISPQPTYKKIYRSMRRNIFLVETRLLVLREGQWYPYVYIWNREQTDAVLEPGGNLQQLTFSSASKDKHTLLYDVPSTLECADCHGGYDVNGKVHPLGPTLDQLNIDVTFKEGKYNQLEKWQDLGLLKGYDRKRFKPFVLTSTEAKAREYLQVHCGHCHNPYGLAASSRLFLTRNIHDSYRYGVCKPHIATGLASLGLLYDIYPGKPEKSLLLQRLKSDRPDVMMPELGRHWADGTGVKLIAQWIKSLPGRCD